MSDGAVDQYLPEGFHAWVQLANAGLVEGSYTGKRVSGADPTANLWGSLRGVNVPQGKMEGGGYTLFSYAAPGDVNWYSGDYNPALFFSVSATLTAAEAYRIDSKLDDGRPGLGRVRTMHNNSNCVSSLAEADQAIATYSTAATDVACHLLYSLNDPKQ